MKSPIKIQLYRKNEDGTTYTVFSTNSGIFVGWIVNIDTLTWIAKPSNGWKECTFENKAKASRYLITSIK